ncbi:hypothetical protein SAMN05421766_103667 [Zobellia uliginosa]|uniref:Uncharacterized protein n=1 Tax=Zobellia uliginosa TaxID=143224 RepID=A0ABY1KSY1_9FLAO|nr:hypothetical protein [Zobellia uliginosa]SIS72963.1 hypothetical protein SAMN05421766_103667 [Zobellia uliginosa]
MVEVLITNIEKSLQAKRTVKRLKREFEHLKIHYDMDETGRSYPCGHTVLRFEGSPIRTEQIMDVIRNEGILCEPIRDNICR